MVEATPSAADCEDLAKAKEACLAEGGVSTKFSSALFSNSLPNILDRNFLLQVFEKTLPQDCSALMAGYLKCMEALKGEEA